MVLLSSWGCFEIVAGELRYDSGQTCIYPGTAGLINFSTTNLDGNTISSVASGAFDGYIGMNLQSIVMRGQPLTSFPSDFVSSTVTSLNTLNFLDTQLTTPIDATNAPNAEVDYRQITTMVWPSDFFSTSKSHHHMVKLNTNLSNDMFKNLDSGIGLEIESSTWDFVTVTPQCCDIKNAFGTSVISKNSQLVSLDCLHTTTGITHTTPSDITTVDCYQCYFNDHYASASEHSFGAFATYCNALVSNEAGCQQYSPYCIWTDRTITTSCTLRPYFQSLLPGLSAICDAWNHDEGACDRYGQLCDWTTNSAVPLDTTVKCRAIPYLEEYEPACDGHGDTQDNCEQYAGCHWSAEVERTAGIHCRAKSTLTAEIQDQVQKICSYSWSDQTACLRNGWCEYV